MSPESVAIDAFRQIRRLGHEHLNGHVEHRPIEVIAAPTVGTQIEYWYEDELAALEKELGTKIEVRVDASLHPERTRVLALPEGAQSAASSVRVGDELEVDLLNVKLPLATSALAVVGDRLVEVENAGNAAGQTIKIKVLDVDEDGTILAEPRAPVVAAPVESKKRRRRGGRGRKRELTAAEQEEQLRELAEEAAKGLGGRPAIGISSSAEAEAEEAEARQHAASSPPLATVTPLHPVPDYAAVEPNGEQRAYASYGGETDIRRRRRRRRRRSGTRPGGDGAPLVGIPSQSADIQAGAFEDEELPGPADAAIPLVGDDGAIKRRRRRRRRRGGRGLPGETAVAGALSQPGAVPERHIFRVDADGTTEATGETAPPEPVRAIARVETKVGPVAVEPPPPILTLPDVPAKVAKPTRRRRTKDEPPQLDLEVTQAALPAPPPLEPAAAEAPPAPKRRGRPPKAKPATAVASAASDAPLAASVAPPAASAAPPAASVAPPAASVAARAGSVAARAASVAEPAAPKRARRTTKKAAEPPAPAPKAKPKRRTTATAAKKTSAKKAPARKTAATTRKKAATTRTTRKKSTS
jgi:hypothetical protein